MWRDPYGRGWPERFVGGLAVVFAVAFGIRLLAALLTPLMPLLGGALIVAAILLWICRRNYR